MWFQAPCGLHRKIWIRAFKVDALLVNKRVNITQVMYCNHECEKPVGAGLPGHGSVCTETSLHRQGME